MLYLGCQLEHFQMFKENTVFLILFIAAAPLLTLCLTASVPVSLRPPSKKAQHTLIGQVSQA